VRVLMKKSGIFIFFIFLPLYTSIYAIVLESELNMSNFGLKNNGSYRSIPDFGGMLKLEEQILPHFSVKIAFERDSEIGNIIWSSFTYQSSLIDVSIGPSLCILNSLNSFSDAISSFQPGINLGINIVTESGFVAGFQGAFAVSVLSTSDATAFLQSGSANIGYRFPNLLAELRYTHKGRVNVINGGKSFFSITDYGLYTETFYKPSKLKIPINIIFRNVKYTPKTNVEEKKNYGTLIFETGFNIRVNSDIEIGILVGASPYSFNLDNDLSALQKFFFRSNAHIRIAL